jgi:hypothetical protein
VRYSLTILGCAGVIIVVEPTCPVLSRAALLENPIRGALGHYDDRRSR